jgi:hypothetical protein
MFYECQQSRHCSEEYVVEAIDYASEGEIYAATFSGHGAKERAEEYAAWKNAKSAPIQYTHDSAPVARGSVRLSEVQSA